MKKLSKEKLKKIAIENKIKELEIKKNDADFVTAYDRKIEIANSSKLETQRKYKAVLKEIEKVNSEIDFILETKKFKVSNINLAKKSNSKSEGIANTVWSDWHIEEKILSSEILGYNSFNLNVAEKRTSNLMNTFIKLVDIDRYGINIPYAVIYLGGDFLSGYIHDELMESNNMTPAESVVYLEEKISSMLSGILAKGKFNKIKVICHTGNHTRYTKGKGYHHKGFPKKTFEWILYHNIARYFENNNKIEFVIPEASQYINRQYDFDIRSLHGHQFKYNGGIGGAMVSINRKLLRWNKKQNVYLNVFGHLHEYDTPKDVIRNGSLVGYNQYAFDNGYEYQDPIQAYFLIGEKRGLVVNRPIYV